MESLPKFRSIVLVLLALLFATRVHAYEASALEVLTALQSSLEKNTATLDKNQKILHELVSLHQKRLTMLMNINRVIKYRHDEIRMTQKSLKLLVQQVDHNKRSIAQDKGNHRYNSFIIKKVADGQ